MLFASPSAWAVGTAAGTSIDNVATVSFDLAGVATSQDSNTVSIQVLERIDVIVTLQSPQVIVAPNLSASSLLFSVTNNGNGSDQFQLFINSVLAGDDFDPIPALPAIYFDTDGSGDFSVGDAAYIPGNNDPILAADASIDILLVNDIPAAVADGSLGRSELTATSIAGTGLPGTTLAGQGDGGIDAIVGASGGTAAMFGEYLLQDVGISITKSVVISDLQGGAQPVTGATLTYTIDMQVTNGGTATTSVFSDPIPIFSTFVANSISLNGNNLTDASDGDAAELDQSGTPAVVVRFGDLTLADGVQTVEFQVTID